jgi:uncharacterized protein YecT (DUF1311 family)
MAEPSDLFMNSSSIFQYFLKASHPDIIVTSPDEEYLIIVEVKLNDVNIHYNSIIDQLKGSMKNLLRRSFTIGLILSVVTFAGTTGAAQKSAIQATIAVKQLDCSNDASLSEQKECFRKDYEQADKELNRVYKQVISDLSNERKQKLIRAQQAWIKYRDTNCEYRSSMWGGVQRVGFYYSCLGRMTRERTKEFQGD